MARGVFDRDNHRIRVAKILSNTKMVFENKGLTANETALVEQLVSYLKEKLADFFVRSSNTFDRDIFYQAVEEAAAPPEPAKPPRRGRPPKR